MTAASEVRSSKRSKSKSRRRANKARRQPRPPQLASRTQAKEQAHDESASPHRSETEVSLLDGECANDHPDHGVALAASPAEQTFFSVAVEPTALEPVHEDVEPLLLRPDQLERRYWFRRQVARLMAGLGAFTVITTAIRIATSV